MSNEISQPTFWLKVKKEYVIENFDSLFSYLREYTYVDQAESPQSDFNRTFQCVKEVVEDYMNESSSDGLCTRATDTKWKDNKRFVVRVMATYLLAAKSKKNIDELAVLAKLADMLLLEGYATSTATVKALKDIIVNCMTKKPVKSLGFTWSHIAPATDFSLSVFCFNLCSTKFDSAPKDDVLHMYENRGVLIADKEGIKLSPMNYSDYTKLQKKNTVHSMLGNMEGIEVMVKEREKLQSYDQLYRAFPIRLNEQSLVTPSPVVRKKEYEENEELTVRVTNIGHTISVETINPAYYPIKGNLTMKMTYRGVAKELIMTTLRIGDYLRVSKQNNALYPFRLDETFESFCDEYASGADGEEYWAVYEAPYTAGHRWVTEEGLYVNIMGTCDDYEEEMANGTPIRVRVNGARDDRHGHLVLNGNYVDGYSIEDEEYEYGYGEDFKREARKQLVSDFLEYSTPEILPTQTQATEPIEERYVAQLSHAMYYLSTYADETTKRYTQLFIARMMAIMTNNAADEAYLKHEMDYVNCCVRFAQGDASGYLNLEHDSILNDIESVEYKESIVNILRNYDNYKVEPNAHLQNNDEVRRNNIRGLINASNMLLNKISPFELNRIKKAISTYLSVDDLYNNIYNDLTYYGEESDTLEFKSSVVFPPKSNMAPDPKRQKWNILKAICGFLNTAAGGELLIGVNDNGNACSINEDINYLYNNGFITEKSVDKLRNYIKNFVDWAFIDDADIAAYTEITATRIKYIIEQSNEGDHIIRIQINPYEYGIVQFANKDEIPEDMHSSYYRTSGATIPMTSELKRQAREKKFATTLDENSLKFLDLQKAKNDKKMVILNGYSSQSGVKNRRVEVYQLIPKRNTIIGYDVDKRQIRVFKTTRFASLTITNENWRNINKHKKLSVDVFDMLENPNIPPIDIELKLKRLAYNLIIEEYANSITKISENKDKDANEYPYVLRTQINEIKGVGRFYLGLAREIKIVKGDQLIEHVREYLNGVEL